MNYSTLHIPSVLDFPFRLKDIIYNCPVCDSEIEIDLILNEKSFIECENCEHRIKLRLKKI